MLVGRRVAEKKRRLIIAQSAFIYSLYFLMCMYKKSKTQTPKEFWGLGERVQKKERKRKKDIYIGAGKRIRLRIDKKDNFWGFFKKIQQIPIQKCWKIHSQYFGICLTKGI